MAHYLIPIDLFLISTHHIRSFFDEVITTVENNRFLNAVKDATGPATLPLKPPRHPSIVSKLSLYAISDSFVTQHVLDDRMTLSWCFLEYLIELGKYDHYNRLVCIDNNGCIIDQSSLPQSLLHGNGLRRIPSTEPEYSRGARVVKLQKLEAYNTSGEATRSRRKTIIPSSPTPKNDDPRAMDATKAQKYGLIPHESAMKEYSLYLPSYHKIAKILRKAQYFATAPIAERYVIAVNLWNSIFEVLYTYANDLTFLVHRIQASRRLQNNHSWLGTSPLNSQGIALASASTQPLAAPELAKSTTHGASSPSTTSTSTASVPNPYGMRSLYSAESRADRPIILPRTQSADNTTTANRSSMTSPTPGGQLTNRRGSGAPKHKTGEYQHDPFAIIESISRTYTSLSEVEKKEVVLVDPCLLWLAYLLADNVLIHIYSTIQLAVAHYDTKKHPTKPHPESKAAIKRQNSEAQAAMEQDKLHKKLISQIRPFDRLPKTSILGGLSKIVCKHPPHPSVYDIPYSTIMIPPDIFVPLSRCPILHPIMEPILCRQTPLPVSSSATKQRLQSNASATAGDGDHAKGGGGDPNYPPIQLSFKNSYYYVLWVQLQEYLEREWNMNSDFTMFRILGRGAFGIVSGLQHNNTQSMYAVKEMSKQMIKASNKGYEWMVINERRMLKNMQSPFILRLNASLHDKDKLYLFTDIYLGGDLSYHIKYEPLRRFNIERARFYAAQVLLGLGHLHSQNVVYRDLKPSNILLDSDGNAVISDLGLSVRLSRNKLLRHVAGTAGYWAPEIVGKRGSYLTSDYWSFGVFLFEMISGAKPRRRSDTVYKRGKEVYRNRARKLGRNVPKGPDDEEGHREVNDIFTTVDDPITAKVLFGRYDRRLLEKDPKALPRRFLLIPKVPKEVPNPILSPTRATITPSAQQQLQTAGGSTLAGPSSPRASEDDFNASILPEIHPDHRHSRSIRRDEMNSLDNDGDCEQSHPGLTVSPKITMGADHVGADQQSIASPSSRKDRGGSTLRDNDDDDLIPLQMNACPMTDTLPQLRGESPSRSRHSMHQYDHPLSPQIPSQAQTHKSSSDAQSSRQASQSSKQPISPRDPHHHQQQQHPQQSSRGGSRHRGNGVNLNTNTNETNDDEYNNDTQADPRRGEEVGSIHSNYLSRLQASSSDDDDDQDYDNDDTQSDREDSSGDNLRTSGNAISLNARNPSSHRTRNNSGLTRQQSGRSKSRHSRHRHRSAGSKSGKRGGAGAGAGAGTPQIASNPTSPPKPHHNLPLRNNKTLLRASYDEQMEAVYGPINVRSCLISATKNTVGIDPAHSSASSHSLAVSPSNKDRHQDKEKEKDRDTDHDKTSRRDHTETPRSKMGTVSVAGQDSTLTIPTTDVTKADHDNEKEHNDQGKDTEREKAKDKDGKEKGKNKDNDVSQSTVGSPSRSDQQPEGKRGGKQPKVTHQSLANGYPIPPPIDISSIEKYIVARCSTCDAFEVVEIQAPATFFYTKDDLQGCAEPPDMWTPFENSTKTDKNARNENSTLDVDIDFNFNSAYFNVYAIDLFVRLFDPNPFTRLGANGIHEIKNHPFFTQEYDGIKPIDWDALSAKLITPPYKPDSKVIHARTVDELMNNFENKYKNVKLTRKDEALYDQWYYVDEAHRENEIVKLLPRLQIDHVKQKGTSDEYKSGCCSIQ